MSDLDDKLTAILKDLEYGFEEETYRQFVNKIKQAFVDAGWVDAKINNTDDPLYLTGAEWYAKFVAYLAPLDKLTFTNVDEAARKASGIK